MENRYTKQTPYDVLGVPAAASAKEIRDKLAEHEAQIRESGLDSSERARRGEKVKLAYDQISTGGERVKIDFFMVDSRLGQMQALAVANSISKPDLSVDDVFKPKRIKVSHEALWDDLERMKSEPSRIEGLVPRPMQSTAEYDLPPLMAVTFDS